MSTTQRMQCTKCVSAYHYICVNISDPHKLTDTEKNSWTCPACQSKLPKKGNSNTPVRSSDITGDFTSTGNTNITVRALNRKVPSPMVTQEANEDLGGLASLITEIKLMRQDMCKMSEHLQSLSESFKQCTERLAKCESRCSTLAQRLRVVEDREIENQELRIKVDQLEQQINYQAQNCLSNELEIAGVNECPNESRMHIVITAAVQMGLSLTDADIDHVIRAGHKSSGTAGDGNMPRPLVVRFTRRSKKAEFLKAAKTRRNMTTTAIDVAGPPRKLYFNERLTKSNRQLFREARMQSKEAGFKYCWTRNGVIFIRKKSGCPEIIIRSLADLERCFGTCTDAESRSPETQRLVSSESNNE